MRNIRLHDIADALGSKDWEVRDNQVMPRNDLRIHEADGSCWCSPIEDPEHAGIWVHHSADRREFHEPRGAFGAKPS